MVKIKDKDHHLAIAIKENYPYFYIYFIIIKFEKNMLLCQEGIILRSPLFKVNELISKNNTYLK